MTSDKRLNRKPAASVEARSKAKSVLSEMLYDPEVKKLHEKRTSEVGAEKANEEISELLYDRLLNKLRSAYDLPEKDLKVKTAKTVEEYKNITDSWFGPEKNTIGLFTPSLIEPGVGAIYVSPKERKGVAFHEFQHAKERKDRTFLKHYIDSIKRNLKKTHFLDQPEGTDEDAFILQKAEEFAAQEKLLRDYFEKRLTGDEPDEKSRYQLLFPEVSKKESNK